MLKMTTKPGSAEDFGDKIAKAMSIYSTAPVQLEIEADVSRLRRFPDNKQFGESMGERIRDLLFGTGRGKKQ